MPSQKPNKLIPVLDFLCGNEAQQTGERITKLNIMLAARSLGRVLHGPEDAAKREPSLPSSSRRDSDLGSLRRLRC